MTIFTREVESVDTIKQAIASRLAYIKDLEAGLPYADHGAYGQDKDRIREYHNDIRQLNIHLERLSADS